MRHILMITLTASLSIIAGLSYAIDLESRPLLPPSILGLPPYGSAIGSPAEIEQRRRAFLTIDSRSEGAARRYEEAYGELPAIKKPPRPPYVDQNKLNQQLWPSLKRR